MFKGIHKYLKAGYSVEESVIRGRIELLRVNLIVALAAILGLLPASLATSLGSDVQRPLATVIVWGLTGSTLFTLLVTPVFYRIFIKPLPQGKGSHNLPIAACLPFAVAQVYSLDFNNERN